MGNSMFQEMTTTELYEVAGGFNGVDFGVSVVGAVGLCLGLFPPAAPVAIVIGAFTCAYSITRSFD